ncbi:60S ribosomal protein L38 [Blastocystis sp. subtype 4]|uniref:60S ribosomal protein L38 n=1 Tax=Blastocystis sp. subtype 4 TaxID=944170 RepID=UPI0007113414|nr:60S ribosomal protein L38 [Blastocystis sp. subtype 4]KNB44163.1 60S ribosomal protein L38 [Blastocystis sp. subtype 4]|eukprot:XP_014527606.1 60S ribosomal protein L38 [Blastocystis sp. subtype 4]
MVSLKRCDIALPKEIKDVRDFITCARRKDASLIKIKKNPTGETKFKVRCSKYLYTLVIKDAAKAERLAKSLPPTIKKENI